MTLPSTRLLAPLIFILLVSACGGGGGSGSKALASNSSSSPSQQADLFDIQTYKSTSPYAADIPNCVRVEEVNNSCTLTTLPIIGKDSLGNTPTVSQIMDHVAVSHDWMAIRFEQILQALPTEMLYLFNAVTAIVIDADIRPAYYTGVTGAIYLDPAYLWLTVEEKRTINPKADYRSGFSNDLNFRVLSHYIKNGAPLRLSGSLTDSSTRTLDQVVPIFANLLLHELTHANDFLPPATHDSVAVNKPVSTAILENQANWLSSQLYQTSPLNSTLLKELGQVMFFGEQATNFQKALTPEQVGEAFETDHASDDYAYATEREDAAMLFEEAMMRYFFGYERDIAFTNASNSVYCSDYIIKWGARNRLGDQDVKARAQFIADAILPNINLDLFFQDYVIAESLPLNMTWCGLTSQNKNNSSTQQKTSPTKIDPSWQLRPYL
ncbi:hypothetical protein [Teredinibacter sp. KSP-S5-2]|uniref:hypothetical protein n=1 Tax=Teredinibacter sp. KSP-S5-2 TaxID=3034506 RepID=UPI0029350454|nr:hypothetical protein [Teredinibacter sp. KSP-S5-2]WNO08922.1 hypothetical protein P5V12_18405 [Teredinibacter sp. KSP-S5-2]